ncbi:AAA family ATPase [Rhodopseudomonas palustris]|uniref:tetratricopeptide repeat protein n=1 Tax=Rhodopseudomonas palustris TaxID=1076 RepID=UPI0021F30EC2|nr:tetratricopeptide repeat protein [Rhodopseudomonas palustris]UYO46200.1 AAA family ATPase [Rhodopseudomonas palustris]
MSNLGIAIYDPRRLDPETFLAGFVARGDFVAFLLDKLRHMSEIGEHFLIVGPRGMGKTSLLRRLAIGISEEPALRARFIPLSFREEQYNVRSLDAFWRNCAESLAEWCEDGGRQETADNIDRSLSRAEWHESNSAGDAFLALCKQLGGRPVLFVDNLDLILDALSPQQNWELRRALQVPEGPIVFGAATQMLRQSAEREAAFYEFFHPHTLHPLSESELRQCMYRLSEARGEFGRPVREVLEREPGRITTLHTLTGGNPRVLTLVYQLLERTESDSVFRDLEVLLDQLTPYYKARIEEYQTDLQRAVIDAIALNWHPVGAARLSEVTAVEVTTISSQLARLKRDGLIEEVETSGARAGYQFVERFFNIWYLMRHGSRRTRQKVAWLTAFLSSFYAPSELAKMKAEATAAGRASLHPFYREALAAAGEEGERVMQGGRLPPTERPLGPKSSNKTTGAEPGSARAEIYRRMHEAYQLASSGRHREALAIYTEVVNRFDADEEPELRVQVAAALGNRGVALSFLGRNDDAIAVYDEVVSRFGDASEPALRGEVALALFNKGVILEESGRREDGVAVYDEVLSRFGAAEEPELRKQVARALVNKGVALGTLERGEDEVAIYDEVVNRFGAAEEPELRERVAHAMVNKGLRLGTLGLREDEIAVYDEVVSRFGTAEQLALRAAVARALVNKGVALGTLERGEDEVAIYDEVVNRFGAAAEPELRAAVARALVNKGVALGTLERGEDEVAIYDEVVNRFGAAEEPELRVRVARALVNKGATLGTLGRGEDEVAVYDEVVSRFGAAQEPALRAVVASALCNKGVMLGALGRSEEALAVYQDVLSRLAGDEQADLRWFMAVALSRVSSHQVELGRSDEAAQSARRAVELDPGNYEAWYRLGNILADHTGSSTEAETAYRKAMVIGDPGMFAEANLIWLLIGADRLSEAEPMVAALDKLDPVGRGLLDAARALARDNFGEATEYLQRALSGDQQQLATTFFDDLLRLLRIAAKRGYGDKLIDWFKETGEADRQAPVYAAFVAFVRGERFLLDFSPEVRKPAEKIFRWLNLRADRSPATPDKPARKRGRPRKRNTA